MIGRVHVVGMRIMTLAMAVIRIVAGRSDDPVGPSDVSEIHVERFPLAQLAHGFLFEPATGSCTGFPTGYRLFDGSLLVSLVIGVGEEKRLLFVPVSVGLLGAASQANVSLFGRFGVVIARRDLDEKSKVLGRFLQPSFNSWMYIQFHGVRGGCAHAFCVDEQENGFGFISNARPDNVVDEDGVVQFVVAFDGLSGKRDLGGFKDVGGRDVGEVEEKPKFVMIAESLIDFTA